MAYNKHFRKIRFLSCLAQNLVFIKGQSGKAPACSGLVLILHRCGFDQFHIGEYESGAVSGSGTIVGKCCQGRRRSHYAA